MYITINLSDYGKFFSKELFDELAKSEKDSIRLAVSKCEDTPCHTLYKLLKDENEAIVRAAISSSKIPVEKLRDYVSKYWYHTSWIVRMGVADNLNCTDELNELLSNDENEWVRLAIARKPNTPQKILEKMAYDSCENVRCIVAQNVNVSQKILNVLIKDESMHVRKLAKYKLTKLMEEG